MFKRWVSVLLLLALLFSMTSCTAEKPAAVQNSSGGAPAGTAKSTESQGELYETSGGGALYDRESISLPNIGVTLQQAVTVGDKIFLYGTDMDKAPVFYRMNPSDYSMEELQIAEENEICCICSSTGSLPILTIDEEGSYVLQIYEGEELTRSLALPPLEEYEDNFILSLSVLENGYLVLTATEVLALNPDGELKENLGSYQRRANCILREDGTALIARTVPAGIGSNAAVTQIDLLDAELSRTASYTCDTQYDGIYWDPGENTVLAYSVNTIFRLDYTNGTREALIDTFTSGIGSPQEFISLGDDKYFSLGQGNALVWQASSGSDVTTLTLAAYHLSDALLIPIHQYNDNSTKCKIKVVDYALYDDAGGEGTGLERLKTDIIAGYTPDLYDLSNLPAELYAARGVLEDLTPWLSGDAPVTLSDLVPSAREALATGDELYYISPSFTVMTVCGDKSFVGDKGSWTPEDFFAAVQGETPEKVFGPEITREMFLAYVLLFQKQEYMDEETLTCNFTNSSFQQFLEFAAQLPAECNYEELNSQSWGRAYVGEQKIILDWLGYHPCSMVSHYNAIFSGEAQFVGFPSSCSTGMALVPSALIGMSSSSHHKDAAMDFLYCILGEENQISYTVDFPIVQACLELKMETWAKREAEYPSILNTTYDGASVQIEGEKPTERETARVYAIIDKARLLAVFDDTLLSIVTTESNRYFNGQISSQQAVSNIQSKAQIYISEQFG